MASLLKSTKNTRWLEDSHRYVRSDVLDKLTKEDIRFLEDHNIRTVVDLRDEAERERQPCVLEKREGFTYYHLPATGGNFAPHSQEEVIRSYIRMADAQMEKILKTIEEAPTNVLYFCSAGKDRTGVVSALLLCRMGAGKDQIVQDYMQSKENLKEGLEQYAKMTGAPLSVITPAAQYMEAFLAWLEQEKSPLLPADPDNNQG